MKLRKLRRKLLAGALAVIMIVGLVPMATSTVNAVDTDKAMMIGMSGIQNWNKDGSLSVAETDKIIMGEYSNLDVEWVRLNGDGLMFAVETLGRSSFQASANGYYPGSILNSAMTAFYGDTDETGTGSLGLTATEKKAIASTKLAASSMHSSLTNGLDNQKFFPLSGNDSGNGEFHDYVGSGTELARGSSDGFWWLRSSRTVYDAFGVISVDGGLYSGTLDYPRGVRPAFNLNMESVLFTSAAEGGKSGGGVATSLDAVSNATSTDWKMTVKDSAHTLATATSASALTADSTITVDYTGASTGHTLSAMVVNRSTNEIMHYGNVASNTTETGTASVTLPSGFDNATHKLVMFTETLNGDNNTDPASEMVEVVKADNTETDITGFTIANQVGTSTIDTANHTVEITMPYGTDVKELTPSVAVSDGATISPNSGVKTDFTNPVKYTVIAEDTKATEVWTVSVNVELHPVPTMTSANNQKVTQGRSISFTSDGDFSGYINTVITTDGKPVTVHEKGKDNGNASAKDGSIVVTLSGEYTKSLPLGTHEISISSAGGSAVASFTVVASEVTPTTKAPDTGDNSNIILLLTLAITSLCGLGFLTNRKRIKNN